MAEEDKKAEQTNEPHLLPMRIIGGAACPAFYANVGAVISTPFDLQIVFAELLKSDDEGSSARAVARVTMAPEHAALLMQALKTRLEQYIQAHGSLRNVGVFVSPSESRDAILSGTEDPTAVRS